MATHLHGSTRPCRHYEILNKLYPPAPLTPQDVLSLEDVHALGLEEAPDSYGLSVEEEEAARDIEGAIECRSNSDE